MKKAYGKCVYDTETAKVVVKKNHGEFGDPEGYEEILFCTPTGNYFVYGNGGETSIYPEETITRVAKANVQTWIDEHK